MQEKGELITNPAEMPALLRLCQEVVGASNMGLHYLALSMALALPDICASLNTEGGDTKGRVSELYRAWCEENLPKEYLNLGAQDVYGLRNGMLHQGQVRGLKEQNRPAMFLLPGNTTMVNCVIDEHWVYSSDQFCRVMAAAAVKWFVRMQNVEPVKTNLTRMIRYGEITNPITGAPMQVLT